ncbi:MAG: FGGY-family carbohydrate kinase [Acidobacteriaceae bacterium]
MSLLAIDIGSSRCKGLLFSSDGKTLAQCTQSYAPIFSRQSFAEMNPDTFLDAVTIVSRSIGSLQHRDAIEAVCLSSHGETLIPVNAAGEPLRSAILNMDNRAAEEAVWCEQQMGRKHLFELTGLTSHAMYPVPKLLWLQKHEPQLFRDGSRFLSVISYILSRLGLPPCIDYSLASRFMAFDIRKKCWSKEILSLLHLAEDALPIPVLAGTIAGELSPEAARQLGLPSGARMVVGGHDQACGSIGAGAIAAGKVFDSMGTYESIAATSDEPQISEGALNYSLNTYCHVLPEKFITLAYFPSGIMVQWFSDLLYPANAVAASGRSEEANFSELEMLAPAGPSGLLAVAHLIGTCNPDFNPNARGAIVGLTAGSHRGHIYKGILEGIACELSTMTGIFERTLGHFTDIYATGGGTRSPLGMRLRAAMTERRFHLMSCAESVCLGGAILAGVAIGQYQNIGEAVRQMVHEEKVFEPDGELGRVYLPIQQGYAQLNCLLKTLECPNGNHTDGLGVKA